MQEGKTGCLRGFVLDRTRPARSPERDPCKAFVRFRTPVRSEEPLLSAEMTATSARIGSGERQKGIENPRICPLSAETPGLSSGPRN